MGLVSAIFPVHGAPTHRLEPRTPKDTSSGDGYMTGVGGGGGGEEAGRKGQKPLVNS